jgi:DNA-binding transcriptional LysR family regulator
MMGFAWDDARIFLAVQRTGSLTAAGAQLHLNQSTVGRRLGVLEEAFGARLFFRTPKGYVATPAGEQLLVHAERLEAEAHALQRAMSGAEASLAGTVRITSPDAFSVVVLTPIMVAFHAAVPEVDIELIVDNRALSLSKREADLALRVGDKRTSDGTLVVRKVTQFGYGVYASKAYLSARGRPKGLEFSGHDLVALESEASTAEKLWLARYSRGMRPLFRANSTPVLVKATLGGLGLGLLPCYLGDAEPELERLVGPEEIPMLFVWTLVHRDLARSPRVRVVMDFVVKELAARSDVLTGVPRPRPDARRPKDSLPPQAPGG